MSNSRPLPAEPLTQAEVPPAAAASSASRWAQRLAPWLAGLGGLGWFLWLGGGAVLPPTRIDWMMREDWAESLVGWLLFRNAPWLLPLSSTPNQFYPYGSSVALTDGQPWLAVLFKTFSAWLPVDFQYTGPWLGLCFGLMGYCGARVVASVSSRAVLQVLGGVLLSLAPVLAARVVHPALCAHWMLVALLGLHLRDRPDTRSAWRALGLAALLNVLGAGLHPYLEAMIFLLTAALAARLAMGGPLSWGRAALATGVIAALDGLFFSLFGYFRGAGLGAEGFGDFSSDLATLFNPMGWSRLLPDQPALPRQGEGFAFLGAGGLLLLVLALVSVGVHWHTARRLPWRRLVPVGVAVLGMTVYALSVHITWRGHLLADLSALYAPIEKPAAALRASGRFIWPLHYLLSCGAVLLVVRLWRERPWVAGVALGLALGLQAYDWRAERSPLHTPGHFRRLGAPEWALLQGEYQHLAIFPTQVQWVCRYDEPAVNALAYVAYRMKLTFNSGYAARTPPEIQEDCRATMHPGGVDAQTVYVVVPEQLEGFLAAGARCGVLEGLPVCVAGERRDAFARALERQRLARPGPPRPGG